MHPAPASKCECPVCDQEFTRFTAGEKFHNNAFLAMSDHVANSHPEALVECPRKTNEATLPVQFKAPVFWEKDGTCSYCGSLSPEKFFEALDKNCELVPTDKNYKVYVEIPNPQAGQEWPLMSSFSDEPPSGDGWLQVTDELRQKYFLDDGKKWIKLSKMSATDQAKFYFMHLSEEQMQKFIDIYNEKKLHFAFPGYFYVSPYFMRPATPA